MREIKFRIWNGHGMDTDPQAWCDGINECLRYSDSDVVVMQYTGLHDKNGVEIYEGDVVKKLHGEWCSQSYAGEEAQKLTHEQYLDSIAITYQVVFNTDAFVGKRHIGYNPWDTDDEGFTYTRLTPERHGYIEVIGNVWETPELLNVKL